MNLLNKLFKIVFLSALSFGSLFAQTIDINKIKNDKHTILFFHMTYCPYCKKMEHKVIENSDIKSKIEKNFNYIDININDDDIIKLNGFNGTKEEFAASLNISFYPTIIFLDKNKEIAYLVKGYRDKTKFNVILDYIKSNSYNDMDISGYIDDLEMNED